MSSIKLLKKKVKRMVYEVLDDCDYIIVNDGKKADNADKLIDEAVDFHDQMVKKIAAAKNRADFKAVKEELDKKEEDFVKKLNALN
jgi:hypothetical protein